MCLFHILLSAGGAAALAVPRALPTAPRACVAAQRRTASVVCVEGGEMGVVQQMSAAFWAAKRAQLRAESDARLRELDEFVAREQALAGAALGGGGAPAGGSSAELSQAKAELEQERAAVRGLQAALAKQALDSELALQTSSAYWISKLAEAKAQLPPGAALSAAAPAGGAAATPAGGAAAAGPDLVPQVLPMVREDMTLKEIRAHLLNYGLSTLGLKSELRERLQQAMLDDRQQHKSWDPSTLSWVTPVAA